DCISLSLRYQDRCPTCRETVDISQCRTIYLGESEARRARSRELGLGTKESKKRTAVMGRVY
ncbi:hypothetical protein KIPB_014599, partial [Kipferlia bialata]